MTAPARPAPAGPARRLRVGRRGALTYAPGEPVPDRTRPADRTAARVRTAQRPPMTTADARALPGSTHLEAAP